MKTEREEKVEVVFLKTYESHGEFVSMLEYELKPVFENENIGKASFVLEDAVVVFELHA